MHIQPNIQGIMQFYIQTDLMILDQLTESFSCPEWMEFTPGFMLCLANTVTGSLSDKLKVLPYSTKF